MVTPRNTLPKKLGIAQNAYSKIEKDEKVKIDDSLIQRLAEILGISIDDIKSPTPIVMNFKTEVTPSQIIQDKLVEELIRQLKAKDEHINKLLNIINAPRQ